MTQAQLTLADPQVHQDPAPIYARLRHEAPVYLDPVLGLWIVSGDAVLREVLDNHTDYSSVPDPRIMAIYANDPEILELYRAGDGYPPMSTLVTTDPPNHRRYRSLVEKALGNTSVKTMQAAVTAIAEELIGRFIEAGHTDFVENFSLLLPVYVVCDLLGIPRDHVPVLKSMAEATTRAADGTTITRAELLDTHRTQIAGQKLFDRYIDQFTAAPADNLLTHLITAESEDHPRLTRQEIHSVIQALLVGGNDTTPGALSSALLLLIREPSLQESLRGDPARIAAFVEEAMRIESPVQGLYRFTVREVVLGGVTLPAGAPINVRYAAANLDETVYPNPGQIDLERKGLKRHLAFGGGIHYCVGNSLARMEVTTSVERLLARLADIRLDPPDYHVRYIDKLVVRNAISLPIAFEQRAR